jgi:hypothetical protein
LLGLLGLALAQGGWFYQAVFWGQVGFYGLGLLGLWQRGGVRLRSAAAAGCFLLLNAASWLAFWVWATGRAARSWHKVQYAPALEVTRELQA